MAQVFVAVILTVAAWMAGTETALSALCGGLTCVVPNSLFVARATRRLGAHAGKAARGLMAGEAAKWVTTVALFVVSFVVLPSVDPLAYFGVFVACQAVYVATPLLVRREN
ncbi:MAG: ATP synthase subunit I [Pseudomonadales bacterium]